MLKLGFTGHRDRITQEKYLRWIRDKFPMFTVWVHGGAEGFDNQADKFAKINNIKTNVIRPDYKNYPYKTAPLTRNRQIVNDCALMVACYDGRKSGGTYYTICYCAEIGRMVILVPPSMLKTNKQLEIEEKQLNIFPDKIGF